MSKHLYLIRHGYALHNELFPKLGIRAFRIPATIDAPLTHEGHIQAIELGYSWENKQDMSMSPYGQASVTQLKRDGGSERTYRITSLYPTEVAAIDVAWDSNDAVEEYSVTFAVNHWVAGPGTVSTASGNDPKFGIEVRADSEGNLGGNIWGSINL